MTRMLDPTLRAIVAVAAAHFGCAPREAIAASTWRGGRARLLAATVAYDRFELPPAEVARQLGYRHATSVIKGATRCRTRHQDDLAAVVARLDAAVDLGPLRVPGRTILQACGPTVRAAVGASARYYGIDPLVVVSRRQTPGATRARTVAMALVRARGMSMTEIGRRFGGFHHASIWWALRRAAALAEDVAGAGRLLASREAA